MKYVLLIYSDPNDHPRPGTAEFAAVMEGFAQLETDLRDSGALIVGHPLQGVDTARTVRDTLLTDGPFAETREHLCGFYLIEVAEPETAAAYAARIPIARYGAVEVRPVQTYG